MIMETIQEVTTHKSKGERSMLTGIFVDREDAERAYHTLHERGYTNKEINLIMSDETRKKYFSDTIIGQEFASNVGRGAGAGSIIGGTVGAIVAILVAVSTSLFIPGLGLIIAGPIAAGLAGAGGGAIAGGLFGAMVGAGFTEETARMYEAGIQEGKIVIGVYPRSEDEAEMLEQNWKENNAAVLYR